MMRQKPMLAYPVSKKPIDYSKKVYIQPKLDGVRCLIQCDNGKVTAYSRTGKEWKNIDHILFNLKGFFHFHPNVILDGELYNHSLKDDFNKIISLVRKTKPTDEDRLEAAQYTEFHCYDVMNIGLIEPTFENRYNFIVNNVPRNHTVKHVETNRVGKHEEALDMHHNHHLANGYEGSIVRTNDPYANKRSHNLRKFKDFTDAEATIIGYEEGKGKREGTLGKFLMQDDDGIQFGCPPGKGYSYDMMRYMLESIHDFIGKRATFTYFERTTAGSYRHSLFKCIRDYE